MFIAPVVRFHHNGAIELSISSESKRRFFILASVLAIGVMGSSPVQGQDSGRFVRWLSKDTGAFLTEVGPRLPLYSFGVTTFLMSASSQDQAVLDRIQDGYHGPWGSYLDVTNRFGSPLGVIPVFGIFELSLLTKNERFQDASFTALQAWIYSEILVGGFKTVLGRSRPETGKGPNSYGFFSGSHSYPSGHTTAAFAIVTTWMLYYPNVATYGMLALSTGTAIARVATNKHWPTDVIAGAALGYFTARWLVHRHTIGESHSRFTFSPTVSTGSTGVVVSIGL